MVNNFHKRAQKLQEMLTNQLGKRSLLLQGVARLLSLYRHL